MTLKKAMEIIASNPAVIFSHSYCPYCVSVKKLLTKLGASYKCVELDAECDGGELQLAVAELTGQRTLPNVFIGGRHIGGCDATTAMHYGGKLVPLLSAAGALKYECYTE